MDFVSIITIQYLDTEETLKGKSVKGLKRLPLMIYWDGKEVRHTISKEGKEIEVNDKKYIIDREVNETGFLPGDAFIRRLIGHEGPQMIEDFDPKKYFAAVNDYFTYYFAVPHDMLYKMISLFTINQHVFDAHDSTPYLYIRSPVRGCGKSHLGQSIVSMATGVLTQNLKAHHIFRMVHSTKPSLAIDEIKGWTASNKNISPEVLDILSLVNTGFQIQGGQVPRLEDLGGGKMKTVWYDSYGPKVFITTHMDLPADTASRCVEIIMQRAKGDGIDYGERWFEPDRIKKVNEIRDMGYLFRLKYGKEIREITGDHEWRVKLDIKNEFGEIKNRELEIFRPLVILCLKFAPEWSDLASRYITHNAKMRSRTEPTLANAVLESLRELYNNAILDIRPVDSEGRELPEKYKVVLDTDKEGNKLMYVSISAIEDKINQHTDTLDLGKGAATRIGTTLKDLGFTTGTIHRSFGTVRILKISRLIDNCERYLGITLKDDKLPQSDKKKKLRLTMSLHPNGITFGELLLEMAGVYTEESLKKEVDHALKFGEITKGDNNILRWNK